MHVSVEFIELILSHQLISVTELILCILYWIARVYIEWIHWIVKIRRVSADGIFFKVNPFILIKMYFIVVVCVLWLVEFLNDFLIQLSVK